MSQATANIQLRVNANGGLYDNGRALPSLVRERILDLNHQGLGQRAIAREVRTSHTFVKKVTSSYNVTNSSIRTPRTNFLEPKIDANVLEYIEVQKRIKPSTYASEIQQRLLLDGVVHPNDLPGTSQINRRLRQDLMFSKKKLTVCPFEAEKPGALERQDEYLQAISRYPASGIHFFDESSVVKTTGNRRYGNARIGERAIEFQRYASNATFTLNLLHSVVGVDYFNILQGPSNGLELLNFFDDALQVERTDGSAALERGDVVVMDNCGFHHVRHIEPLLRNMFNTCGIELIYQPPYSPHFNTCEYCFNQIKQFLQLNQVLAMNETEVAIGEAISHITAENSAGYFRKCGYLV
ncbi:hypothetical protein ABFA07_014385 [Porites harrisoni]